ncbi:redoxin domain-containing protein [Deinococcus sp. HMF7604]|uniref:redoxin domain-containing protein n=1 Tax=Deinococcus betulae TaxID=2873312 RepID=UPI001CCCFEB6|nr:redoxin domain-containing protein [Deinococcus betulae]MBZ9751716.1 redoxin domain-containing protein [Deinococcus betulae]
MNTSAALLDIARHLTPQTPVQVLTLSAPAQPPTQVALKGEHVCGIQGPVTPSWQTTLRHSGVHPAALHDAQQRAHSLDDALGSLIRRGQITPHTLHGLARDRLLHALLPLLHQPVTATLQPSLMDHWGGTATPRVPLRDSVSEVLRLDDAAPPAVPLSQAYAASPAHVPAGDDESFDLMVYRAALQGQTLQTMAQRLPLRFDQLRRTLAALEVGGYLWPATGAPTRPMAHPQLQVGDVAPDFVLAALGGGEVRLSSLRGQRVWLSLNRQSTCAICNPRHAEVIAVQDQLVPLGVKTVSVWGSGLSDLGRGIGKQQPPYAVLADPADTTYARYGLTFSLAGTLDPRNLSTMSKGFRMMGLSALKSDGELFRMPAEFLIGKDGRIERVHYSAYGADFLPIEEVLAWARRP